MRPSTNLATRPFRNERLPWLLAGILAIGALVLTFSHARLVSRLLTGDEAKTVRGVREDEARVAELEDALSKEPPLRLDGAELTRLRAIKELVDRRAFPWRRLLSELEATLSPEVKLTNIAPTVSRSGKAMVVALSGEARTKEAAFSFAESLDRSDAFVNAVLKSLTEEDEGTRFDIEVTFDPVDEIRTATAEKAPKERTR